MGTHTDHTSDFYSEIKAIPTRNSYQSVLRDYTNTLQIYIGIKFTVPAYVATNTLYFK